MKVTFIKNPVGQFNLVHEVGETVEIPAELAHKLIEAKVAKPESDDDEVETADSKATPEKAIKKKGK